MTIRKQLTLMTSLIVGICFLIGFLYGFQAPKLKSWTLMKLHQISDANLSFRVLPSSLEFQLLPLGISLQNVKIQSKPEVQSYFDSFSVAEISVEISALSLLQGQLKLREVRVTGVQASARLPKMKASDRPPLEGLFAALKKIPVSRLFLNDISLTLDLTSPPFIARIRDMDLAAENTRKGLALDLQIENIETQDKETNSVVSLGLETSALVQPHSMTLTEIKLRRGVSYLVASGALKGNTERLQFNDVQLATRASINVESTRDWLVRSFRDLSMVPPLKGRMFIDANLKRIGGGEPLVTFNLSTDGLFESHFFIDKLKTAGTYQAGRLELPKFEFMNPGAYAVLKDTVVLIPSQMDDKKSTTKIPEEKPEKKPETADNKKTPEVSNQPESESKTADAAPADQNLATSSPGKTSESVTIRTRVEKVEGDLNQFIKTLGKSHSPVYLTLTGQLPACEGIFTPRFFLICRGELEGRELLLNEKGKVIKGSIAAIPQLSAKGEFTVDANAVSYQATLKAPNSEGRSSGTIVYDHGFKIDFEASQLSMSDIANLADLRLEGNAKITGSTQGNSDAATLEASLIGNDVWFENYWLGYPKTNLNYKAGVLTFANLSGYYTVSRYSGDIAVHIPKKTINMTGKLPFFDSRDMLKVFSRRVKLPFAFQSTGKVDMKVWGPLEFTKLSYDLKTTLYRGVVSREPFDQAHFDVRSRDGEVTAERVDILRNQAVITMTGVGHPNGDIETVVHGRDFKLEDSVNVQGLGLSLSGLINFEMNLKGWVLGPLTTLKGSITKSAIGDQGVPDSNYRLRFTANTIEGGGDFMGDLLQTNFVLPLNEQAPFSLKLKTNEWNYAPLFSALAGPSARRDYEGRLTSSINLSAASGGFWNSTGTIQVDKFSLRRGVLQMTASEPVRLRMSSGRLFVDNFNIEGDGTYLRMAESTKPINNADVQVNGKLDMSLLALMLPFFDELRGSMSFAFNFRAGPKSMDLLGSVYVDKGYLKLFEFPHPFEDIRGDFLFSQKKLLINSINAEMAGGKVTGEGNIEFKGYKNTPLQVSAVLEKVRMNLPDKMQTTGSGRLFFTGNWFPFKMKGVYDVRSGLITREFTEAAAPVGAGVQRSAFLPRMLLQDDFSPLDMDIQVNIPTPIDIKNSMAEGRLSGHLNVKGPPAHASVLGTINAEKDSKIIFRKNEFDLTAGVATFNDPNEINPNLYLTARARVAEFDVNLILQGTPKKPELSLSSSPPLSEPELISMLAIGAPGESTESFKPKTAGSSRGNEAATAGVNVGGDFLEKNPVNDQFNKITGIEVGFSTGYDAENNVAVPKITANRKISKKMGVTASRSIGQEPKTEAKVHYQLSRRLSVVGSWEGKENKESAETTGDVKDPDTVGLDFEYKFEFK